MKKGLFLLLALVIMSAFGASGEIYIALTNFPAQGPVVDSFRYKLANFKDDDFYFDVEKGKLKFTVKNGDQEEKVDSRYSVWMQKNPADLVFIIPGLGDHYRNSQAALLAEAIYNAGYSVAIVSNPFCWEFAQSALTSMAPGYTRSDAKDLYHQLARVLDDINAEHPGKVKDVSVVGYSLGALQAAFMTKNEVIEHRLNIKRYVLMNPPVNLIYGLTTLDRYYNIWKNWDKVTLTNNRNMAVGFYKGYSYGALQTDTYLPITEEQASFVIGFMFRMSLGDVMKKIIERHPMKIFGEVSSWKQQEFEKRLERYGYQRYVDTFLKEAHPTIFATSEPFKHVNGISSLPAMSNELRQNQNIVCLHTADDFLLNEYDRNWLKRQMGDRLVMLDHGSHLGYFCMPQALDIVVKLIKGETVSGPRPATAQPTYHYFDAYLAKMAQAKAKTQTASAKPAQPAKPVQTTQTATASKTPVMTTATAAPAQAAPAATRKEGEMYINTQTASAAAPAATIRDGRKVEWRLMPDPGRTNETVLVMQEVDVESGLLWEEYQAKAKAEAEAKAKKIAEEALAKADRERAAKEREEKAERERVRNAEKAKEKTLEATPGSVKKASDKPKKTVESVKKAVAEATSKDSAKTNAVKKTVKKAPATKKKGGSGRDDVKMESTAPEKTEEE
ncbi:alpha/beta fold hydrolase [bacterium]|nr:alpha/beta fold hydrolase [bacterium]